jgi:uncharacterized protein
MRAEEPWCPPLVLSRFDVPGGHELLVHSCEDCACPVSDDGHLEPSAVSAPLPAARDPRRWVLASETAELRVDAEHYLLFNPLGRSGAVVVNRTAYEIYRDFAPSARPSDVAQSRPGHEYDTVGVFQRLGQLEMIHPAGEQPRPKFKSGGVMTAWLHVTNGCNLRCPYCYITKSGEAMDESTGRAAVEAVVRSALAHGFTAVKLKYAGGEASLNHQLVIRLHAYARELASRAGLQLHGTLLSNGVSIPADLIRVCKSEGIRVMISLDGVGDQHDIQRFFANGNPSFRFVERTIAALIEQDWPPHLSMTITSRNAAGLPKLVRFALDRDLTFSFNLFRDNDCASSFPDLRYEEEAMTKSLLAAFDVIESILPRWSVLGAVLDRGQLLQPRQRSCGVGEDYVVIDQRGDVAKCHMEIERTLGDVFTDDPLDLVRRDNRTALNLLVDEKAGCRECTWRYWCSGGCSVATFRATGRYDVKSPNCNIYKAIYPRALQLEGFRLLRYAVA